MGKMNDVGVFQLDNGLWAYRYTFTRNGKRYSKQSSKDEYGNPLRTRVNGKSSVPVKLS